MIAEWWLIPCYSVTDFWVKYIFFFTLGAFIGAGVPLLLLHLYMMRKYK